MYIILAILIFGFLIIIHEAGHFVAAKLSGVQVNEFAICMGPAIVQKTIGETTYSLRCIPIGGFCAMEGEDEDSDNPRAFTSAKAWKRLIILVAGSFMNYVAGAVILLILFSSSNYLTTPIISDFYEGCVLESEQGLQTGDQIYKIDGERVYLYSDISTLLARNQTGVYDLVVIRDGEKIALNQFEMHRQEFVVDGQTMELYGMQFAVEEKTFWGVLQNTWYNSLDFVRMVRMSLQDLISGAVGLKDMSGPVGIVSIISDTGEAAESTSQGVLNVLYLAAFIAINLAVMNLLPIPALDGGRVLFLLLTSLVESVTRRKVNPKYEGYIHAAGMVLLLSFMAVVTFQDIFKLIVGG